MDFWDATKVMFRRWYVALPLLLLTGAATFYTVASVKPDYVLTSYVQLIPSLTNPDRDDSKDPRNPWNLLGLEALNQAASYAVLDQTFLDHLDANGQSINFSVIVNTPEGGATIEVVGATREQAVQTTETILERYSASVKDLQTKYRIQAKDIITVERLDAGQNLKRPDGKVKRAVVVVAGAGLLMSAGVTIALDALLRTRRRRRGESKGPVGADTARAVDAKGGEQLFSTPETDPKTIRVRAGRYGSAAAAGKVNGVEASSPGEQDAFTHQSDDETVRARVGQYRSASAGAKAKTAASGAEEATRMLRSNGEAVRIGTGQYRSESAGEKSDPTAPRPPGEASAPPAATVNDATIVLPRPQDQWPENTPKRR